MAGELATIEPEQYERKHYIGGSDIPGVLGVSGFGDSPVQVYYRKVGDPLDAPKRKPKKPLQRGKLWEKVVGEMLVAELEDRGYKVEIVATNQRYIDPAVPFFAAEIDYELRLDWHPGIVNCELKTVSPFASKYWPPSDTEDQAPPGYVAQVMHGLGVTGRSFGVLAALFGADELRIFPVPAVPDIIMGVRDKAAIFWREYVEKQVPPPALLPGDVDRLFRTGNGEALIADSALIGKALRLRELQAQGDAVEAEGARLEFEVKQALQSCEFLVHNEQNLITWKNRKFSVLDQEGLKADHPDIHKQYMRSGTTRAFSVLKSWRT